MTAYAAPGPRGTSFNRSLQVRFMENPLPSLGLFRTLPCDSTSPPRGATSGLRGRGHSPDASERSFYCLGEKFRSDVDESPCLLECICNRVSSYT